MSRNTYALVAAAMAIGLAASGCSGSTNSATKTSSPASATQLQSLIPTPANTQRTDGPDTIPDSGIHLHFLVNGSSTDVMDAYKTALQGKGWAVTVVSSGGWQGAAAPPTPRPRATPTACLAAEAPRERYRRQCLRMAVKALEPQLWWRQQTITAAAKLVPRAHTGATRRAASGETTNPAASNAETAPKTGNRCKPCHRDTCQRCPERRQKVPHIRHRGPPMRSSLTIGYGRPAIDHWRYGR